MDCPVCKTERLSMMERQGIEIDFCPKCRGVWLDRGELDKIVERSTMEGASAPIAQAPVAPRGSASLEGYDREGHRPRHDDRYAGGHRRKSFLQDLFD